MIQTQQPTDPATQSSWNYADAWREVNRKHDECLLALRECLEAQARDRASQTYESDTARITAEVKAVYAEQQHQRAYFLFFARVIQEQKGQHLLDSQSRLADHYETAH